VFVLGVSDNNDARCLKTTFWSAKLTILTISVLPSSAYWVCVAAKVGFWGSTMLMANAKQKKTSGQRKKI
jgi:hypothetical protein